MEGKNETSAYDCMRGTSAPDEEICKTKDEQLADCIDDGPMLDDVEANGSNQDWVDEEEAKKPLLSGNAASISPFKLESENQRLASLDVFRGLTVAAMILVDYGGGFWSGINHTPWDGISFADFVVPAFLFIVGVSLALTHKKLNDRRIAAYKVSLRVLKLFGLGLILQGGFLHGVKDLSYGVDIRFVRIMGVLQRIAIAYLIVALFEVSSSRQYNIPDANESFFGIVKVYWSQWVAAFVLTSLYVGILYGLYIPDWKFEASVDSSCVDTNTSTADPSLLLVKCNVRGSLSPGCNAVGFVDRSVMGISHLYQHPAYMRTKECSINSPYDGPPPVDAPTWCLAPFDPEGILSSLMAVVTCFIGAHYGHVLLHVKGHKRQLWQWTISAGVLLFVGLLLDFAGIPLNKQLYTVSYTCVTGGAVALTFSAIYALVDMYKWRSSTALFKWVGVHALMIYALFACGVLPIAIQGFYWESPKNNLINYILTRLEF